MLMLVSFMIDAECRVPGARSSLSLLLWSFVTQNDNRTHQTAAAATAAKKSVTHFSALDNHFTEGVCVCVWRDRHVVYTHSP